MEKIDDSFNALKKGELYSISYMTPLSEMEQKTYYNILIRHALDQGLAGYAMGQIYAISFCKWIFLELSHTPLGFFDGSFCTTMAAMTSFDRDYIAHKD